MLFAKQKERYKESFFIALFIAFMFFIPFILMNKGYFLFYGDFDVQQVPFYKLAHKAVTTGDIYWNWNTDLGANFIGSYSFYLIGSPFFWLTLPFPNDMVPYLMGPLLMLKFACSSFTAYCYLRRFCRSKDNALIGALLYAFSGFSIYNIFFNHFHEAIVFFPLLLLSLEQLVCENRRGFFAFMVFVCSMTNYYFFAGMFVFLFIYWVIRTLSGNWEMKFSTLGKILLEGILGGLMACIILFPSYYAIIQNSRIKGYQVGWGAILFSKNQRFLNVIQCFFFPPDNPARPVFFPDADARWQSQAGWLPLFGMTGVIAWLQNRRKTWQRRIIITLLFMALVPILNSAFYMFNYAYYARWFYMLVLMMALVTAQSLDRADFDWSSAFRWNTGVVLAFTLVIGFYPSSHDKLIPTDFGLYNKTAPYYKTRFWVTCLIALASAVALILLFTFRGSIFAKKKRSVGEIIYTVKKRSPAFTTMCICLLTAISVGYAGIFIYFGKQSSYDANNYVIPDLIQTEFELEDSDKYRIDVYEGMDNTGMFLGIPTIQAFHSIVPGSVTEYYEFIGVERGVGSRPEPSMYSIRSFLNCQYLVDSTKNSKDFDSSIMPGWSYVEKKNNFAVWQNDYCIPYGFTYDYCISETDVKNVYKGNESLVMLKAMVVSEENEAKISSVLKKVRELPNEDFSYNGYFVDCTNRRETSINNDFSVDNRGFTSTVSLDKKNYVFYTVPYEEGWTAYVDGKKVDIEKVNVGFMAVLVGEGEHTIRFEYMTPGLEMGLIITMVGFVLLVIYMTAFYAYKRKHPEKVAVCYPEGEKLKKQWAAEDAILAEYERALAEKRAAAIAEAKLSETESEPEKVPEVNDENDPFKIDDNFDNEEVKE
ncbi:MAG: YfhO family protein [Clostridia bacterium]|nr:YfhO family protein [Clostridia bacterium]